jgi:pimeloyl-ACP methyl ester carboxylesterase
MSVASHTLGLPGVRLYSEARGAGPVLIVAGAPTGAAPFSRFADALTDRFTLVTHDPRGVSGSTLDDSEQAELLAVAAALTPAGAAAPRSAV